MECPGEVDVVDGIDGVQVLMVSTWCQRGVGVMKTEVTRSTCRLAGDGCYPPSLSYQVSLSYYYARLQATQSTSCTAGLLPLICSQPTKIHGLQRSLECAMQ